MVEAGGHKTTSPQHEPEIAQAAELLEDPHAGPIAQAFHGVKNKAKHKGMHLSQNGCGGMTKNN